MLNNFTIKAKVIIGSFIPLILFVILGIICLSSLKKLEISNGLVEKTHSIIEKALKIESAAIDMETGMRGFLLSGKESFLIPYNNGKKSFKFFSTELLSAVSDNPELVERLEGIKIIISEWQLNVTNKNIQLRRDIGDAKTMDDMAKLVGKAEGEKYFNKFRSQVKVFIERESSLMSKRKIAADLMHDPVQIKQTMDLVAHTYDVISQAMEVKAAALDMEAGMRGYLLAGIESFLSPYHHGKSSFSSLIEKLKNTVSDNPMQIKLLNEIEYNILGWEDNVTEVMIELRRKIGNAKTMNDMAHLVGEENGKEYFDKFRTEIAEFISIETNLMKERQAIVMNNTKSAYILIISSIILAIILSLLISYMLIKSISRIKEASDIVSEIATGNLSLKFSNSSNNDEISNLLKSMKKLLNSLRSRASLTNDIALGKIDMDVELISEKDELGSSLKNMVASLNGKVNLTKEIVKGNVNAKITLASDDDELGKALKTMTESLKGKSFIANEISRGNLQVSVPLASDKDELGLSLQKMIDALQQKVVFSKKLAQGNLNVSCEILSNDDELGRSFQSMIEAMKQKASLANEIAQGNLGIRVKLASEDDGLGRALQSTIDNLKDVVGNIVNTANAVDAGINKISMNNVNLQQRTETQACTLEETAASMNEIASGVKGNNETAKHALTLSKNAEDKAHQGGKVVENVIAAIGDIDESSKRIGAIIGVIDEIAFQTNLLALNAAVEAARAGEQGRGFAVVASEVRTLAQRSASSAKEIKNLIEDSMKKVKYGTDLAKHSGDELSGIVEAVVQVNESVQTISTSCQEQATGIDEINIAITEMDNITQQNSAVVEGITASGKEMQLQTKQLQLQVSMFTLSNDSNADGGDSRSGGRGDSRSGSRGDSRSGSRGDSRSGSRGGSGSDHRDDSRG
ncbi:MAG: hypothetical protein HON32_00445 [Francisellaceae bacterium]|nr:hypothetical protein [Francisellaceae bacterium]